MGPGGHVEAADIDCRHLTGPAGDVDVRALDIRTDTPEPDSYDLVHCRALLMHLPDPRESLRGRRRRCFESRLSRVFVTAR